jgi:hypothetical protein
MVFVSSFGLLTGNPLNLGSPKIPLDLASCFQWGASDLLLLQASYQFSSQVTVLAGTGFLVAARQLQRR